MVNATDQNFKSLIEDRGMFPEGGTSLSTMY